MPKSALDRPEYLHLQQSIHKAEVDFNYTFYFPLDKEYQYLFPRGVPKEQSFEGSRPPLWYFVEKCMVDNRLEAFKNGQLDQELAKEGLVLEPRVQAPKFPPKRTENQAKYQVTPGKEDDPALDDQGSTPASGEKLQPDLVVQQQRSPQVKPHVPGLSDFNRDFIVELSPDPELARQARDSLEEDDEVMLNIKDNEPESGEISENSSPAYGGDGAGDLESGSEQQYHVDIRGDTGDITEDDDAMVGYADADQPVVLPEPMGSRAFVDHHPQSLAELSEEDLAMQIRYFYTTCDSQDLDLKILPVRCLVCAERGHTALQCPALTCAECGAYNAHFVPFCPKKKRCPKCRGQGHDQTECTSKLKLTASEIECNLCHDTGHTEDICELIWRTSGAPKPLNSSSQQLTYIYCYECGQRGHLGNDCTTRRPGKRMGTSTWSFSGKAQPTSQSMNSSKHGLSIKGKALPVSQVAKVSNRGLSIKGSATQRESEVIVLDSEEDDDSLVRPRVPAPTRNGQIRIETPMANRNQQASSLPSMHQPHHGGQGTNSSRMKALFPDGPYMYPNHPGTRSRPNPNYVPPPPREKPEQTQTRYPIRTNKWRNARTERSETYHPMPSAAQNAWKQHRI